jgi:integrase
VGERSERVQFSTRLHNETPGAWEAAETIRLKKEKEVLDRVLYNRPPPRPMEELAADYLARHDYSYGVRSAAKEIARAFKGILVADLDRDRIEAHFNKRFPPHERGSRWRHEAVLHAMLALALRERSLYQIPYWNRVHYERPTGAPVLKQFQPGEVELLVECADYHLKPIIAVMYATGARLRQTMLLRREHVHLERGRGRVVFPTTKSSSSYMRPLHDYAVDQVCIWLLRRHDHHPQLFLTQVGKPYVGNAKIGGKLGRAFRMARERCAAELERRGYRERARVMAQATPNWLRPNFANTLRHVYGMDARGIADAGMWEDVANVERTYVTSAPEIIEHQIRNLPLGQGLVGPPTTV